MFETSALLIFITAAVSLLIIPGPAVTFIIARTVEHGRMAGFISELGILTASLIHTLLAAFGLSALLLQSAVAFSVVKYAGAAYLIFMGIQSLRSTPVAIDPQNIEPASLPTIYRQGFVVNLFNPKGILFFFAFLPQFVAPERGNPTFQIVVLGLIFVGLALISDSTYMFLAGAVRNALSGNLKVARFQKNFAGVIYIVLGLSTAFTGSRAA
ncbi:MAG: threonine/homoserine/homoserine lactone efflux protein [Candidatus Promineifilaceae bacterium]|jgi:threonine/homoserine/homoserine lactone efflux protein